MNYGFREAYFEYFESYSGIKAHPMTKKQLLQIDRTVKDKKVKTFRMMTFMTRLWLQFYMKQIILNMYYCSKDSDYISSKP
jgi:hypothetical protein